MTFLSMAPWQGWLLLGLTATAVIVIFFLRIQHRRVLVSSSLLWDRVLERRKRRSWLEILRRVISLLIALAIALALAMTVSEAEPGSGGEPREVAIVIDNSLSMTALRSDGRTRLEYALGRARDLLERGSGADRFAVHDRTGRVVAPASRDRTVARAALERLAATAEPLSLPPVDAAADLYLITDGVGLGAVDDSVRVLSVYEPGVNAGVTAFEVRPMPTDGFRYEAFLEVGNFSPQAQDVLVVLEDDRQVQFRRTVSLEAGGLYRNTFDLSPLEGGPLRARATVAGDAMPLDDEAWVYLPRHQLVRVGLVGEGESEIEGPLRAESHVELVRMTPPEYEEWRSSRATGAVGAMASEAATDPIILDGLIFDGYAPAEAPSLPALLIAPPPAAWLPAQGAAVADPGPPDRFGAHPLLSNVDFHDLLVTRAVAVEAPGSGVLVAAGATPLLIGSDTSMPWVMTTFRLRDSDLPDSLTFALFVANLVEWIRNEPPAQSARPGIVTVALAGATVSTADGTVVPATLATGHTLFRAQDPGLYYARAGRLRLPVAVNAGSRQTSAINVSSLADLTEAGEEVPPIRVLWPTLLALAAALLVLEGLTYHRRITV